MVNDLQIGSKNCKLRISRTSSAMKGFLDWSDRAVKNVTLLFYLRLDADQAIPRNGLT